ncbi:MAG: TolC family outer membrane protein [bacterium]
MNTNRTLISVALSSLLAFGTPAMADGLTDVYRAALTSDPQLAAAEAKYEAALQAKPQARSAYLPQLNASASLSNIDQTFTDSNPIFQDSNFDRTEWGIGLRQAIFHKDYWAQLEQADAGVAQAQTQILAERQGLILRVAKAYFDVLTANESLTTAIAEKSAIGQQLTQTQEKFDVGLIAITDVRDAQARFDLTSSNVIASQAALQNAQEALRAITGSLPDILDPLTGDIALTPPEPSDIDQWVETAKENNLQLKAAGYGVEAARQGIEAKKAGHYPTLDLVGNYGSQEDKGGFQEGTSDQTSIGLDLVVPIYSGGRTSAQVKQAQAEFRQAVKSRELAERQAEQQVRASYLNVISSMSQVKALKQALESTRTAADAAQAGYDVGTRTSVDVLLALQQTYRAQRDFAVARHNYILNTLQLKQAAGTLSEDDLTALADWF